MSGEYEKRVNDAIDFLRAEVEKGFYSPDKEYLEILFYAAKDSIRNPVNNTTVLLFIMGYQGGTVHQVAEKLKTSVSDILDADEKRMEYLMRQAQKYRNTRDILEIPDMIKKHESQPYSLDLTEQEIEEIINNG